ncbi:hypothetical protein BDF20DRAFT_853910 [Mycotypha africana]|uniref:uncharacterized protein n=1 Tax=Mycotypha africana TaxID=64632 RepID=UPI002300C018|nr:uncharacterized protein BDF20DRAFT_853910 [Mycotypha africana]KAI8988115.1 hypothetical protein BDF20DRAFT_853910 [Mycotypha africana]
MGEREKHTHKHTQREKEKETDVTLINRREGRKSGFYALCSFITGTHTSTVCKLLCAFFLLVGLRFVISIANFRAKIKKVKKRKRKREREGKSKGRQAEERKEQQTRRNDP